VGGGRLAQLATVPLAADDLRRLWPLDHHVVVVDRIVGLQVPVVRGPTSRLIAARLASSSGMLWLAQALSSLGCVDEG
jgi:hypothetical protein